MPDFDTAPVKVADFCDLAGVSRQRVTLLRGKGILPADGTLRDWLRAYIEHLREGAAGRAEAEGDLSLTAERAALARSRREKVDLEVAELRGVLVNRADIMRDYTASLKLVASCIQALGGQHAHHFVGLDDERVVLQRMDKMHRDELTRIAAIGDDGVPVVDPFRPPKKRGTR